MTATLAALLEDGRRVQECEGMISHLYQHNSSPCIEMDVGRIGSKSINFRAFSYYGRLSRIRKHVDRNPDDFLTLPKAARIAGLSSKYFSSFFHLKVGVCFTQWYAHVRVLRAIMLMRDRNDSITNIAMDVGFRDLRTFERLFKRHTGVTPRQFKNAVRPS